MPRSQNWQRLSPCASMRSKTVSSPAARVRSSMVFTEPCSAVHSPPMVAGWSSRAWPLRGFLPTVDERGQALDADPRAVALGAHRQQRASISLPPQLKQVWVMTAPPASLAAVFSAATSSSNSGASRFSTVSAPSGQTARQKPAPSQSSSFTTLALPSTISMAPSAQGVTHRPQPVQSSSSMWTMLLTVITVICPLAFVGRAPRGPATYADAAAAIRAAREVIGPVETA